MEVDTKVLTAEAKERQQSLLTRMTAIGQEEKKLDEEKQLALYEVLRIDGEIRLLQKIDGKEGAGDTTPKALERGVRVRAASDA